MDILQVSAYCGPTGGNYVASMQDLAQRMKKLGYTTIYALSESIKGTAWCRELQEKSTVYFLPVAHARLKKKTYSTLRKIYSNHDIAIIHSHFELYDIPVVLTAPKSAKIFWHLHDPIADSFKAQTLSRKLLIKLQYACLGRNVKLITRSEKHGHFASKLGFNAAHTVYIPNGLDLARIHNTYGEDKNPEFLMFCWDFYRKGGDIALKAADRLYSDGYDFKCRFVPPRDAVRKCGHTLSRSSL